MSIAKWNHRPKDSSVLPEFHLEIHVVVSLPFIFSSVFSHTAGATVQASCQNVKLLEIVLYFFLVAFVEYVVNAQITKN